MMTAVAQLDRFARVEQVEQLLWIDWCHETALECSVSRYLAQLLGIKSNEDVVTLQLQRLFKKIHADEQSAFVALFDFDQQPSSSFQRLRLHTREGVWKWYSLKVMRQLREQTVTIVFQMLDQYLFLERALEDSQMRYRGMSNAIQAAMIHLDRGAKVLEWNRKAHEMFGFSMSEMLGKNLLDFIVKPDGKKYFLTQLTALKDPKIVASNFDTWCVKADKSELLCAWSVCLLRDSRGKPFGLLAMALDVTEQKAAKEKLEMQVVNRTQELLSKNRELKNANVRAESATIAKSQFLANMSHEIRTPLNAVIGLAHIIQRDLKDDSVRVHINKLMGSAEHLLQIINEILDLSKIDAGAMQLEQMPLNIGNMLQKTVDIIESRAESKNLGFELDIYQDLRKLNVIGDELRLRQVLLNLMGNAIKFTSEGKVTLKLEGHVYGQTVFLSFHVIDTGIGISESQCSRLFREFEQAETSTTRRFGGTGLGLAICKRLVELMGGVIGVVSVEKEGSDFWFNLELPITDLQVNDTLDIRHTDIYFLQSDVLLVEDNIINQEVATQLLQGFDIRVDIANNGLEAVNMVNAKEYDLVLMDVHMPQLDGLEATKRIRVQKNQQDLPILAMTASTLSEDYNLCIAAGMNGVVAKPIDLPKFYKTLSEYLPHRMDKKDVTYLPEAGGNEFWDTLDLVDRESALEVWGNERAYFSTLSRFCDNYKNFSQDVTQLVKADDASELARYFHSIKGASGSLMIKKVPALVGEIEKQARDHQMLNQQMLLEIAALLQSLCVAVVDYEVENITDNDCDELSVEESVLLLEELIQSLELSDFDETVLEKLRCNQFREEYNELRKSIENYDFDLALEFAKSMLKKFKE